MASAIEARTSLKVRLGSVFGFVGLLHLVGWGFLLLVVAPRYPEMLGLGLLAYTLGLRHAFDADHIAAIDNTTRKFMQEGKKQVGVGFFFSLGHSMIVAAMALGLAVATSAAQEELPFFQSVGGVIGTSVSGVFLYLIGILNLVVLIDIVRIFREMRGGMYDPDELERRLASRGLMNRFAGPLSRAVKSSWQMFPIGLLFGLGFDTASEVALLALSAGAASGGIPVLVIMLLPLLFASGMSLVDTADGAFMAQAALHHNSGSNTRSGSQVMNKPPLLVVACNFGAKPAQAYDWAFSNPIRKVYYNLTVTGLSVAVALLIWTIELLQISIQGLGLEGGVWGFIQDLDFGPLGYIVVGMFVAAWAISYSIWRYGRIEQRWSLAPANTGDKEESRRREEPDR